MLLSKALMMGGGEPALDIADAFSTDLYTGNGGTQTITNGVDVSTEGGLVWIKSRSDATDHQLFDTNRGSTKELISNTTAAETTDADTLTAFNSTGFDIGADANVNTSAATYAAWTFRQAPKFFDVVTYTGDGTTGREIPHNLGSVPGMIIIKGRNFRSFWPVYHRSNTAAPETDYLVLNTTAATVDEASYWNDTAPTDSVFTLGSNGFTNDLDSTYVAYLFAHDTDDAGVIQCGSYTGNGNNVGPVITLGWEPQYLLIKSVDSAGDWYIFDAERGIEPATLQPYLFANTSNAEMNNEVLAPSSTGFQMKEASILNTDGDNYIYMAIRAEGT